MALCDRFGRDPISEVKTSTFRPCFAPTASQAIPDGCNELFEKANHSDSIVGGARSGSVTAKRSRAERTRKPGAELLGGSHLVITNDPVYIRRRRQGAKLVIKTS